MIKPIDMRKLGDSRLFFESRPSGGYPIYIFSITALMITCFIWASIAQVDETLKAPASIRPMGSISSIRSLAAGEIVGKYYVNDMTVEEGDVLWVVDSESLAIQLENLKLNLQNNQKEMSNYQLLSKSIQSGENLASSRNPDASVLINSYFSELKSQEDRLFMLKNHLEQERRKPENLRVQKTIDDLESEVGQLQSSMDSWISNQEYQAISRFESLQTTARSQESEIANVQKQIEYSTVIAPISGRIVEIKKINLGDTILSGEEMVRIVPQDDRCVKVEIYVNPASIARIHSGQKVKLRFPGLPVAEYGQMEASINLIPSDVAILGDSQQVFIVEAEIPDPVLYSMRGEQVVLHPGMTAEARIVLKQKTVLRMILNKLDFLY